MTDQELRALVRDAVQRHLAGRDAAPASPQPPVQARETRPQTVTFVHPSQFQYRLVNTSEACLIEPGVTCNHCGYCKTHGH